MSKNNMSRLRAAKFLLDRIIVRGCDGKEKCYDSNGPEHKA